MNKDIKEIAVHFPRIEVELPVAASSWLAGLMATIMHDQKAKLSHRSWAEVIWQQIHDQQVNMDKVGRLTNALQVIVKDPVIRTWLTQHDPKALEQAQAALK